MDEEIKKILEENLKLTQEIYKMTKKIKGYITFQKIMSLVYIVLIVGPIILSVIYLKPILNNVLKQYQDLLGGEGGAAISDILKGGQLPAGVNLNNIDSNKLPPELQKYLKK